MAYKLRACANGVIYDIKEYTLGDNDIYLETTVPDYTINLTETEYVIVLNDEKENLLNEYEDDGRYVTVYKEGYARYFKGIAAEEAPSKLSKSELRRRATQKTGEEL